MDIDYEYHYSFPTIDLPLDGRVPQTKLTFASADEFDHLVSIIDPVWNKASALLSSRVARLASHKKISENEVCRAWKRWLQSHHSFFPTFSLLAYSYDRLTEAVSRSSFTAPKIWSDRISRLWKLSGALMLYGCDFRPRRLIYENRIRPEMPEAFAGFWLREWHVLSQSFAPWQQLASDSSRLEIEAAALAIKRGRLKYRDHHRTVMVTAVSDGKSLDHEYRDKHGGCPHDVTEVEFKIYDEWFRIVRINNQNRIDFVRAACHAFAETLDELAGGHRLSKAVTTSIARGIQAGIQVFGEWLGSAPETSKYYPRNMRGE